MLHRAKSFACLALVALSALAGSARAQSPSLTLGAYGKRASVSFTLGSNAHRPSYFGRRQVWMPGHYETRCERVWVPGCARQVWEPARYEWRYDHCGKPYRVCLSVGRWISVTDAGRYENREYREWVPGRWCAS